MTRISPFHEPENPDPKWFLVFTWEEHQICKDLLANLLPLSSAMNVSLSNKSYSEKKSCYAEDSMFKSTRQFAKKYARWTPQELLGRSEELVAWAITLATRRGRKIVEAVANPEIEKE